MDNINIEEKNNGFIITIKNVSSVNEAWESLNEYLKSDGHTELPETIGLQDTNPKE